MEATYFDKFTNTQKKFYDIIKRDIEELAGKDRGSLLHFNRLGSSFSQYLTDFKQNRVQESLYVLYDEGYPDSIIEQYRQAAIEQKFQDYVSILSFEICNRKVFNVDTNLVEHLAQTSLEANSEFARLPFDACMFTFSSPLVIKSYCNLVKKPVPKSLSSINVFAVNLSTNMKFVSKLPANAKKSILFNTYHIIENIEEFDMFTRSLPIQENKSIDEILKTEWKSDYKELAGIDEYDTDSGTTFYRILLNTILYLNSNDVDMIERISPHKALIQKMKELGHVPKNNKSKKLINKKNNIKEKMKKYSSLNYAVLGKKLGKIKIIKPNINWKNNNEITGVKIGTRFMVRGHWRNQPYGTEMTERKLIWIKPYFKGPDMAALINKPYDVI